MSTRIVKPDVSITSQSGFSFFFFPSDHNSKSRLKGQDTLLKDPEYRGKSTNRKELFESLKGVGASSDEERTDSDEDEELSGSEEDNGEKEDMRFSSEEEANTLDEDGSSVSDQSDDASESEVMNDEESGDEQEDRRDKVRQLLAQETKY